ncbi:MAG: hypothetical protein HFJ41_06770 [Clostridia bacterium]|nr:hypothetical protein [Clostridia bacterium]
MGKNFTNQEQETLQRMQKANIKKTILNLEQYHLESCNYVRSLLDSLASSLILYDMPSKVLYERVKFVMKIVPNSDADFIRAPKSLANLNILLSELKAYIGE